MENHNLFAALRAAFPADLSACAVETDSGLCYSWQDLEDASAMVATMLESLDLPMGARIAVQVEKSVEALMLYLATLRAELAAANSTIWALTDHHNQTDQTLIRERAELAAAKAERDAALARAEVAEALLRKARMFVECFATPADGNFDSISTFKVEIPADGYQRQWAVHAAPAVMVDINAAIGGDHV